VLLIGLVEGFSRFRGLSGLVGSGPSASVDVLSSII